MDGLLAIAIDPSYISKSGKKMLVRKKFFMKKVSKYHFLAERKDK